MNNIQGGHVTCYVCEVQALAPQFGNSPWTGSSCQHIDGFTGESRLN
jgi:hypothetical protein